MYTVSRSEFEKLLDEAIGRLPKQYIDHLKNVAFIVDDEPSLEQRQMLQLRGDQTLFGLYEGVPLSQRQGMTKLLPDKITLFQKPIEFASNNPVQLRERIGRTIWHEVAHYYGLDHGRIHDLERQELEEFQKKHKIS